MNIQYFSIYDSKTQLFGQVFPSHTYGSAQRSFQESVNDPNSPHAKHPDDFTLYNVFTFDDEFGNISSQLPAPVVICKASDLISPSL